MRRFTTPLKPLTRVFAAVQCLEGDAVQDMYNIVSQLILEAVECTSPGAALTFKLWTAVRILSYLKTLLQGH